MVLMSKNKKVFSINDNGNVKIFNATLIPYGLYVEESSGNSIDTNVNNLMNFNHWCASRVLSLDRKFAKVIYNAIGLSQTNDENTKAKFAMSYHCLSIVDTYWTKLDEENIDFEDKNLFENNLSHSFIDVYLKGKNLTIDNKELVARDTGTLGLYPKAWKRFGKDLYLLKDGSSINVRREVLASRIIDCFNINHVSYEYILFEGKHVSKCKCITNIDRGIVNFSDLKIYCANKEIGVYDYMIKLDKHNYYMMNIVDYLIGNSDRHDNNWGVFIDTNNNKALRLYDLMDYNHAFENYSNLEGGNCLTSKEHISQKTAAIEAVKIIGLNMKKKISSNIFDTDISKGKMFFKRLKVLQNC